MAYLIPSSSDMPMTLNMPIYIINYKNEEKRTRMLNRFKLFNIDPIITKSVEENDERLVHTPIEHRRIWSVMLQHMDSINDFYYDHAQCDRCIVCEDDVHISRDFINDVKYLTEQFVALELDILLMGYLLPYNINMETQIHQHYFPITKKTDKFVFHEYPQDIWGCQMYMISRKYAKYLLDTYTLEYAYQNMGKNPYNPDWIITKNGKKSLIVPMIAVEEGQNQSTNRDQIDYHTRCFQLNYDEQKYI